MTILAIETSCDETAAALIAENFDPANSSGPASPIVLDEVIASQVQLHAQYGGVVPELAAREHLKALPVLVGGLLEKHRAHLHEKPLTRVAVTVGPGLKGSLLMGVNFAKGFAIANNLAVEGINHIEAHLLSPLMNNPDLNFPFLGVIISGGHTELLEVHGVGDYRLIERTTDDAAGEAFDKCAALLGIPYPGGAELSRLAGSFRNKKSGTIDERYHVSASRGQLSYSGLKTSFRVALGKLAKSGSELDIERACCAVEDGIVQTLRARVGAACAASGLSRIALSGGVAANGFLRAALRDYGKVFCAETRWCGDNAAMIGFAAALRHQRGLTPDSLLIRARWPVEEMNAIHRSVANPGQGLIL